jgi:hypothetical protein
MYINYLNREHFDEHDDCNVDFDLKLKIEDCVKYSDEDYRELRTKYLTALEDKIKANPDCSVTLNDKLEENIAESEKDQLEYETKLDEEYEFYTEQQLEKIKNNKQKMKDLQINIVASEQRLSDSKGNNYRNKVKLIIFIVAIIVFVLIELILIIV